HSRYSDKRFHAQSLTSAYALHVGRYFALAGRILPTAAPLTMPLSLITAFFLYLDLPRYIRHV
ncbi:hypothetical protein B1218_35400, partial [Pseudomonas ogarae]